MSELEDNSFSCHTVHKVHIFKKKEKEKVLPPFTLHILVLFRWKEVNTTSANNSQPLYIGWGEKKKRNCSICKSLDTLPSQSLVTLPLADITACKRFLQPAKSLSILV